MERKRSIAMNKIPLNRIFIYIIIVIVVFPGTASAFSYEESEITVPWGEGPCEVYTDFWEFDWSKAWELEPWYTTACDAFGDTAYIYDFNPETSEASIIEINFETLEISEWSVFNPSIYPPTHMHIIGGQDEFFIAVPTQYICYDYQRNVLWQFNLPRVGNTTTPLSELYILNDNLWGIVVMVSTKDPVTHKFHDSYELWKLNTLGEIVARVRLEEQSNKYVFDISADGDVAYGEFVDMYEGVYKWGEDGKLLRREGSQIWEFEWYEGPENFVWGLQWRLKPLYNGTVYSFEYTEEGIRIKRYTYVP